MIHLFVYASLLWIAAGTILIQSSNEGEELNRRPIIAVLAQIYPQNGTSSYIAASYVKYLESAGARVVPIPHTFGADEIRNVFSYVNGVLFPGGGITWFTSVYYKHAKLFWDLAMNANDNGDYFPIWGTCLGFEALHVLRANSVDILSSREASDVALPLKYTALAERSRLFGQMSDKLFIAIGKENLTYNHHRRGISPQTYKGNPLLNSFFKVLSTNLDVYGKEFISTVEAFRHPVYGSQWHPEKNNFEFTKLSDNIPHSSNAVKASQYTANFFVDESRKSTHRFPSSDIEEKYLIYRYTPVHSAVVYHKGALRKFEQIYLF